MSEIEELKKRIEALEYQVYQKWIKTCPRCRTKNMNRSQKGYCMGCAYKDGEYPEVEAKFKAEVFTIKEDIANGKPC